MIIFNSYVKLPEGKINHWDSIQSVCGSTDLGMSENEGYPTIYSTEHDDKKINSRG